jgi:predicted ATPase/predicted Ser/Thr protein kinase
LSDEGVVAFVEGRLPPERAAEVEAHASHCAACAERISATVSISISEPAAGGEPEAGRWVGGYRIVAPLGYGGAGVVYRAVHGGTGAEVALKTVRAGAPGLVASIQREIRALSRLAHPGIVRILDQGVDAGRPFYAMELIEGRTLQEHLAALHQGGPPGKERLHEALAILRRLALALAFLHGEGVVHRDLTPRNVVLRPDGSPVLVDFGLALREERRERLAGAGSVAGTLAYMAPEQIRGEGLDARADLYAFGAILFHALTGAPPFGYAGGIELLRAQLEKTPPVPSQRAPGIEPALDALVAKLLEKRPRDRIGYAEDVAAALARVLPARPPAGEGPPPRPYVYRPGFAGRDAMLRRFDELLAGAAGGHGRCVLVGGKSGVGKTRLTAELAVRARTHGFQVLTGECFAVGERSRARHPFRALLRALVGPDRSVERLSTEHTRALAVYETELDALLADEVPAESLAPQAGRFRLLEALSAAFAALAAEGPLLFAIDDLQWADELSLDFLESLPSDFFASRRVLLVATHRTEEPSPRLARLARAPFVQPIALDRLSDAAISAMVGDMLALHPPPAVLAARVARAAEGNAFCVAEYVRAAVDAGWIVRDVGSTWRLTERARELPQTLPELVARRLAVLGRDARALLEAAAVLGMEAEPEVLFAMAELAEGAAADALVDLQKRAMLEEGTGDRLRFAHDAVRNVAYESIPAPRRSALHLRAARALAARHPDEHAMLAHHFAHAGDEQSAMDHLERAGEAALAAAGYAEAAAFFEEAIAHGRQSVSAARRARWDRRLGEAYYALGDLLRCEEHSARALAGLGLTAPRSRLDAARALVTELVRQARHLRAPARDVAADPQERARLREAALAAARLAHRYYFAENGLGLVSSALLSVNLAERAAAEGLVAEPYAQIGYLTGTFKLRALAERYFSVGRRNAEASRDAQALATVLSYEALHYAGDGRLQEAHEAAVRALHRLAGLPDAHESEVTHILLAHIEYLRGRYEEAMMHGSALVASARARDNPRHEAFGHFAIARCRLREARFDDALAHLGRAQAALEGRSDDVAESIRVGLAALAHLGRGDEVRAEDAADTAMAALARSRPSPVSSADGHQAAAEVYVALWARCAAAGVSPGTLPARARRAGAWMRRSALLFRMSLPSYLIFLGRERALSRQRRLAAVLLGRAQKIAQEIGMPYEADQAARARRTLEERP